MAKSKNAASKQTVLAETATPGVMTKAIKIALCSCKHEFQDSRYGNGRRVFNKCADKVGYRCTICGTTKS